MQGDHPSVAEGRVVRKICFHHNEGCCTWSIDIRVRNCGRFFVYELPKPPMCFLRFCGNSGQGGNLSRNVSVQTRSAISLPSSLISEAAESEVGRIAKCLRTNLGEYRDWLWWSISQSVSSQSVSLCKSDRLTKSRFFKRSMYSNFVTCSMNWNISWYCPRDILHFWGLVFHIGSQTSTPE